MGHLSPSHQWDVHRLGLFLLTQPWAKGIGFSSRALHKPLPLHNQARRPGHGRGLVQGSQDGTSETQGLVYPITARDALVDQSVSQGKFLLFRLWAEVLLYFGASH